jgi:Uma2 family endonuclease
MIAKSRAKIEDLYRVKGKAEIVNGKIVRLAPPGGGPGQSSGGVCVSLRRYERRPKRGYAYPDNVGFLVDLPNRQSYSPDAAFHADPPSGLKFMEGAPIFAVEMRSEGDYSPAAERAMAEKRNDYFAAGTQVVWDVDLPLSDAKRWKTWRIADLLRKAGAKE